MAKHLRTRAARAWSAPFDGLRTRLDAIAEQLRNQDADRVTAADVRALEQLLIDTRAAVDSVDPSVLRRVTLPASLLALWHRRSRHAEPRTSCALRFQGSMAGAPLPLSSAERPRGRPSQQTEDRAWITSSTSTAYAS